MTINYVPPQDLETHSRLAIIAARIPADVLADLKAFHEGSMFGCAAHSEGQLCCLDFMDPDAQFQLDPRWADAARD